MDFFKTRVFIATIFFLLGMATNWLWMQKKMWHFSWSSGPSAGAPMAEDADPFGRSFGTGFEEMRRMQEEMLRSFNQMEDQFPGGFQGRFSFSSPEIVEDENGYRLEIELHGMQPKNFRVQVEKGQLQISGSLEESGGNSAVVSQFSRSFPIPSDVDADRIQVETKDDRMLVLLPKKK